MIKVKATRDGYYPNLIRAIGEQFEIKSSKDLGSWMEVMDKKAFDADVESESEKAEKEVEAKAALAMLEAEKAKAPEAPVVLPPANNDLSHLI